MALEFRKLTADDIEVRAAQVKADAVSLLLFKDARVDQRLLDETVGAMNWQRSHEVIGGNLYCTVSIYDPHRDEWVSKQDVGTESNTEKEKGQASDSFKRACFNWGIGRELYTAPRIWINAPDAKITKDERGKYVCYDRFSVQKIDYDKAGRINALVLVNQYGKVVFDMNAQKPKKTAAKSQNLPQNSPENNAGNKISVQEAETLKEMLRRAGRDANTYRGKPFAELTPDEYVAAVKEVHAMGAK